MTSPENNNAPRHAVEMTSEERQREQWTDHLAPILDQLNHDRMRDLDQLNEMADQGFAEALARTRNQGVEWYEGLGLSRADALAKVEEETIGTEPGSISRSLERRLMRGVMEDNADAIESMLPNFIGHLDKNDPDYEDKVDSIRQALETAAAIPRGEWWGHEDEDGEPVGDGYFHELIASYDTDEPEAPSDTDDEPETVDEPDEIEALEPSPRVERPGRPTYERRRSVTSERYGAQLGQTMAFRAMRPDGGYTFIHYQIVAFPKRLPGQAHPPVTLRRIDYVYGPNQQLQFATQPVEYEYSADHIKNLGKDVKACNPKEGSRAIDLQQYWEKMIPSRERKERVKRWGKRVLGAAALVAVGIEAGRRGHDIGAAMDAVKDLFHMNGHELAANAPAPHDLAGTPDVHLSPEQQHIQDVLNSSIKRGQGGIDFYKHLGLDQNTWFAQEHGLADKFPHDFYTMNDGHVGLNHPGKPLSPEAAQYIAKLNGLLK